MGRAEDFIAEKVAELEDMNDEVFIGKLAGWLHEKTELDDHITIYTRVLFHQGVLARLARIRRTDSALFLGRMAPAIRKRRDLFYPEFLAAMDEQTVEYDPFAWTDGATLLERQVRPTRWLVEGLIADGLTMFGGPPKGGKSALMYALTLGVAVYGHWIKHWTVETGKVLHISLEDDEDDTRLRLHELDPDLTLRPDQIQFLHGPATVPTFDQGFLAWLTEAIEQYRPRLVVIDPLSYLYSMSRQAHGDLFAETRSMLFPLRWLGKEHHCAIVALDHRRKRSRDDVNVFDTLHGSNAKQAVADTIIMVDRDDTELTMEALVRRGRDATHTLTMEYKDGRCWLTHTGEATPPSSYGEFRQLVYTALRNFGIPVTIKELLEDLELPDTRQVYQKVHRVCLRGVKNKDLEKTTRGAFVWASKEKEANE